MMPFLSWINKKRFGQFTLLLSPVYFIAAIYQITMFIGSKEMQKYGVSLLVFPFALFLVLVGAIRLYFGYLLLKNILEKWPVMLVFGFLCFVEIFFGFFAGLIIIDELKLIGSLIVALFVIYYIYAFFYFKLTVK